MKIIKILHKEIYTLQLLVFVSDLVSKCGKFYQNYQFNIIPKNLNQLKHYYAHKLKSKQLQKKYIQISVQNFSKFFAFHCETLNYKNNKNVKFTACCLLL